MIKIKWQHNLFLILLFVGFHGVYAQTGTLHCDSLIQTKQYLSAYECLQGIDGENKDVDIVLKKTELALTYNIRTIRNHLFAFVDMRKGENFDDLKEALKSENFPFFEFKIDTVLQKLIEKYPDDYRLVKALGDFYYNTYKTMGDHWFIPAKQLLNKFYRNYLNAYEHGVFDAKSLYALAFYNSVFGNYDGADEWYRRSLELDAKDALTVYGYGVNCLLNKKASDGIRPMLVAY